MKNTVAIPAPLGQQSLLETAELQQLAQKAKGPWKNLEKGEIVQCEYHKYGRSRSDGNSFLSSYRHTKFQQRRYNTGY